ncbi:MAG: response regulator [Bdellovibrionota bacterium]|nr:response regulator [Bdellovibrionota bacterium]
MMNLLRDFFESHRPEGIRVFLVDDDPDILNYLERHLTEQWKFNVQTFTSVSEARAELENGRWPPFLVISDVKMPDDNGLTLKYNTSNVPIIFMTTMRKGIIQNDDFTIISKPLDLRTLDTLISKHAEIGNCDEDTGELEDDAYESSYSRVS